MSSASAIGAANMATDPNMKFHMGMLSPSLHNSHVVSFQSGAVGGSPIIFPLDRSGGLSCTAGSPGGVMSNSSTMTQTGSSSGSLLLEQMTGLKADTGLAADWSFNEQLLLEAGLRKFADEQNMMKYIKIAATLHDKTVRDVALRCRWMTKKESGKRRKPEEYFIGKKVKDRKEKMVDSTFVPNMAPCQPASTAAYSITMPRMDHTNPFACEVPVIDAATQHRIDENILLFQRIEDNFESLKLRDNINLLSHSRSNINSILTGMRGMPGIMSQMPPLPVGINEELADAVLPCINQQLMFGAPGGIS